MLLGCRTHPAAPKGRKHSSEYLYGTAEAVPFQNKIIPQAEMRLPCPSAPGPAGTAFRGYQASNSSPEEPDRNVTGVDADCGMVQKH